MAFVNDNGEKISYDCTELICELENDIAEFGGDLILEVVTQEVNGVTIYKDYNFIDDDKTTDFKLNANERLVRMTASALMEFYKVENEIL